MDHDRIWTLMARRFAEEITAEELRELEQLLKSNPGIHFPLQMLSDSWTSDTYPKTTSLSDEASKRAYARHLEKLRSLPQLPEEKKKRSLIPYLLTLLVVVTITYLLMPLKPAHLRPRDIRDTATTSDSRATVMLPDGSQVKLNAGSKLTYTEVFGRSERHVELSGEAYFIVPRNEQKPLMIYTRGMALKALGTTFNVKSYPGEQTSEAALISGRLEISLTAGRQQKIDLHPSEKLVISTESLPCSTHEKTGKSVDEPCYDIQHINYIGNEKLIQETSWINNQLVVQNQSLESIMTALQRRHGITVTFKDEDLRHLKINGVFRDQTLGQVLQDLAAENLFSYHTEGRQITISRR